MSKVADLSGLLKNVTLPLVGDENRRMPPPTRGGVTLGGQNRLLQQAVNDREKIGRSGPCAGVTPGNGCSGEPMVADIDKAMQRWQETGDGETVALKAAYLGDVASAPCGGRWQPKHARDSTAATGSGRYTAVGML